MKTIKITADNKISIVDVDFSNNRAIMDKTGRLVMTMNVCITQRKDVNETVL